VQQLIETVMTEAAMLDHAPFEARFDGVMSFGRGEGRKPLVAVGGEGLAGMIAFQQALCVSLERAGLPMAPRAQFKPHITLLYDDAAIEPRAIEPITWTVGEFFLVHSRIGETRHELIRRWPLRAAGGTPQAQ
jgi:2'-5' RNA ligase